jgi:LAS seventeen-binding protein 5
LTDAIKQLAADSTTDQKVKKKLVAVLASWHSQFKDDPSMSVVAGLYGQCRPASRRTHGYSNSADLSHGPSSDYERKMKEKDEKELAKQRAKREKEEAKERTRKAEAEARKQKNRARRAPFNFEAVGDLYCRYGWRSDTANRRSHKYSQPLRMQVKHRVIW